MYLIEGRRLVTDALLAGAPVETLLVRRDRLEDFQQAVISAQQSGIEILSVSAPVIDALSETLSPEGIMAAARICPLPLKAGGPLVALDRIQDPGNLGTIIRTCDAAGTGGVLLSEDCVELYNPKTVRSAMGSVFNVPVQSCGSLAKELLALKKKGYTIAAAALNGTSFYEYAPSARTVLIIGNEGSGISREILELADVTLTLPMRGGAQSLNASIAAGIMIYGICFGTQKI